MIDRAETVLRPRVLTLACRLALLLIFKIMPSASPDGTEVPLASTLFNIFLNSSFILVLYEVGRGFGAERGVDGTVSMLYSCSEIVQILWRCTPEVSV